MKKKPFSSLRIPYLCLLISLTASSASMAYSIPTDNPYKTKYGTASHWTNNLQWSNTYDATANGVLTTNTAVLNTTNLRSLITTVSNAGGGVIFFPAGTYNFSDSILLQTGVVLRGVTPSVGATNAAFAPTSKLVFPQYVPTLSGSGTPITTAFKFIGAVANAHDFGLVNLDINRASITIQPNKWVYTAVDATGDTTYLPADINYNVLVFGIRSNNTAIPSPNVPNATTYQHLPWQRIVWTFSANIDLYVSQNGVVCNSRLNDNITDSYNQPGFQAILDGTTTPYTLPSAKCGATSAFNSSTLSSGVYARFDYANHYGIVVNRAKINKDGVNTRNNYSNGPNNPYGIYAFITGATQAQEPQLYAPGNEVQDNWVYTTQRIKIQAGGNGLKVFNNITYDSANSSSKNMYLDANGYGFVKNNSATYENRGMDISGWNTSVENNDITAYSGHIYNLAGCNAGTYPTVDGEGILMQRCCGGPNVVNSVNITGNNMRTGNYIGIYKTGSISNLYIGNNNMNGTFILAQADINDGQGNATFNNVVIENNTNVNGGITTDGTGGGNACTSFIQNNSASAGSPTISYPCMVTVQNNTGLTPNACDPVLSQNGVGATLSLPTQDTTIGICPATTVNIRINILCGTATKVNIYNGTSLVGTANLSGTTATYALPIASGNGNYSIYAKVTGSGGDTAITNQIQIVKTCITGLSTNGVDNDLNVSVSPLPASQSITVTGNFSGNARYVAYLYSSSGQLLLSSSLTQSSTTLDIQGINSGLYILKVASDSYSKTFRVPVLK